MHEQGAMEERNIIRDPGSRRIPRGSCNHRRTPANHAVPASKTTIPPRAIASPAARLTAGCRCVPANSATTANPTAAADEPANISDWTRGDSLTV